jgi:hypothetical protein
MDGNIFDPGYQAIASVGNDLDALRAEKSAVRGHSHCGRSLSGMLRGMFGACVPDQEKPDEIAQRSTDVAKVSVSVGEQPSSWRVSDLMPHI